MVLVEVVNIFLFICILDWNNWCWFKFGLVLFSLYIGELIVIVKLMIVVIIVRIIVNIINCIILILIFIEYIYVLFCCLVVKFCKWFILIEKYIMSINISIVIKVFRKVVCVFIL